MTNITVFVKNKKPRALSLNQNTVISGQEELFVFLFGFVLFFA